MEPAGDRRDDLRLRRGVSRIVAAQLGSPMNGGDDLAVTAGYAGRWIWWQWSPPMNARTTYQPTTSERRRLRPAMEPTRASGMTRPVRGFHNSRPAAATEPAGNQRDDNPLQVVLEEDVKEPQWSPPLIGGTTTRPDFQGGDIVLAAMEPAGNGGMTSSARGREGATRGRSGARR
jgi:hypothetical protein